jgi:acetylornithine aminotransferase
VQDRLIERAATLGATLLNRFTQALGSCEQVAAVRGKGLMLGIELKKDCPDLVAMAAAKGLLINVTAGKVIRLLPPLVMTDQEVDILVNSLCDLIRQQP